jgi:hypothetical protein
MKHLPPRGLVKVVDRLIRVKLTFDIVVVRPGPPRHKAGTGDCRTKDLDIVVIVAEGPMAIVTVPLQRTGVRHIAQVHMTVAAS